jgi:hypothetical protein
MGIFRWFEGSKIVTIRNGTYRSNTMSNDNPPADHAFDDDSRTGKRIEDNLRSGETWMRGLFMLVSCVLASVATFAGSVIVVLGFFYVLFTGEVNLQIKQAGQSVATYIYNIARYLTFNTDEKPFPMGGEWPSGAVRDD